jgi:hypothetical protein
MDDILEITPEVHFDKDARDVKRSLVVDSVYRKTTVFVVAVSPNEELNKMLFIPCYGIPVTQEVYDSVRDGFVLFAQDYHCVGTIPVSYRVHLMESEWATEIPLPMSVIKRYLGKEQKSALTAWESKFGKGYRFITVQMLGVY